MALFLQWFSGALEEWDWKIPAQLCNLTKILGVIVVQFIVQGGILFSKCRKGCVDNSQVMAWLSFEVMAFYLNIMAMAAFLLLSLTCRKYRSVRDRCGMLAEPRKKQDFLTYCSDDMHWFCVSMTQLALVVLALVQRAQDLEAIQWCCGVLFARHLLEQIVISRYYNQEFDDRSVELGVISKALIGVSVALNCGLVFLYINLEQQHSVWWAPVLLLDIVLHFLMFGWVVLEFYTWEQRENDW
jgi:hypothetical protein